MIIAIIGGIGSGKSAVKNCLKTLKATVYDADEINQNLIKKPYYIELIRQAFPSAVQNNAINKSTLAQIVYNNQEQLNKLNQIAHPQIKKEIDEIIAIHKNDVAFIEIPLLIESNMQHLFDKIWLVKSPESDRIERVILRDGVDDSYVKKIISRQANDLDRESVATDVIINDGTLSDLQIKVETLYKQL
ncbi:MAG: dephospho-CoA kinase [Clostridia bacterium]